MHEKFWDEESQSYKDHYIENTETGEITFKEIPENIDGSSYDELMNISLPGENGEVLPTQRHTIDEYNSLIARIYEKYYANYS